MSRPFKNALCTLPIPDAAGYTYPPYFLLCKRRKNHPGRHRVKFQDGGVREWSNGDLNSELMEQALGIAE